MSQTAPDGAVTRARTSVTAIETIAEIHRTGRTAAEPHERRALLGWSGWGPLTPVFAPPTKTWLSLAERVQDALSEADFKLGAQATYSAFYTPRRIAELMWQLLTDLGFEGGTVLEPGCGGGVFFDTAPAGAQMVGVERDPVSARIVQALHPQHKVINAPLQQAVIGGVFTAAIGNVPFGDVPVADAAAPDAVKDGLHNYFIWRTLRHLAPGGIAVLLTSRWTMDSQADIVRAELGKLGDFLGAVRLPNGALGGGTDAIADLVVVRRVGDREVHPSDVDTWIGARSFTTGLSINTYWDARPDMVLGDITTGSTSRYGLGLTVVGDPAATIDRFETACIALADRALRRGGQIAPPLDPTILEPDDSGADTTWWDFAYRWEGGVLWQMKPARKKTAKAPGRSRGAERVAKPSDELVRLIRLRDLAQQLVAAEADHDRPDTAIVPLRDETRAAYEDYESRYGAINRCTIVECDPDPDVARAAAAALAHARKVIAAEAGIADPATVDPDEHPEIVEALNLDPSLWHPPREFVQHVPLLGGFRNDPDFQLVAALEQYDDDSGEYGPAPILSERQNRRPDRPVSTDDPMQALAWSMDRLGGKVDLAYIATALGVPVLQVPVLLAGRIFRDPTTLAWQSAEEYLSGNVREKLRFAEVAAATDPDAYTGNVAALRDALPVWLEAHDITAQLGASWIPPKIVQQFIVEVLEEQPAFSSVRVKRLEATNRWEVKGGNRSSNVARLLWGTRHRDAFTLVEDGLNGRVPKVRTVIDERSVEDPEKSAVAVAKLEELQAKFGEWLWEEPGRRAMLVAEYNERHNALVARKFDGSHVTVAGLAPWFKPYEHQREFVARAVSTPAALCGHAVGGGKTATMAMAIMKLIELGLIKTGMVTVPRHLLEQTARQMRQLFPAAKVLAMSSESIGRNRREFAARCATGGYQIVIITHPAFNSIRVAEATEADYLERQKEVLESALRAAAPDGRLQPGMIKAAAKAVDKLTARITELRHHVIGRDTGTICWEQLGIGYLFVDEAHLFKNLALAVFTEGFSIKPSKRATDLDMKLWWMRERSCGMPYAALATGTPISNTMLELYVVLQYLMQPTLQKVGLGSPDAWAATFVKMVTSVEVTVDGGGFRMKTRPGTFFNAPELRLLLSQCADIKTREQLGLVVPEAMEMLIVGKPTAVQDDLSADIVARVEEIQGRSPFQQKDPDEPVDNMLAVCTDGRRGATDPALLGLHDPEPGKLGAVAQEVLQVWEAFPTELQIIFCDMGTPNAKKGPQTYGRIKERLIAGGMPADRIVFVHDATSGRDRAALFARCRSDDGPLVIMGSTEKLGVGTNIQTRGIAMHHVDAPFRPADVEQRDGRFIRPGNRNKRVFIFRYITERTFDAYMWQLLARKIAFIKQILTGELGRTVEDVTPEEVLSFAAAKAAATGQPLLQEQADLNARIARLEGLHRNWRMAHRELTDQIAASPRTVAGHQAGIDLWQEMVTAWTGTFTDDDRAALTGLAGDRFAWKPIRVSGLRVARGTWRDARGEDQPTLLISGPDRTRHEHPVRLFKLHTADDWIREFQQTARDAAGEAALHRRALQRHVDHIEVVKEQAKGTFTHEVELAEARARLAVVEEELRAAAAPEGDTDRAATDEERENAAVAASFAPPTVPDAEPVDEGWLDGLLNDPDVQRIVDEDLERELAALAAL
jgi:N12 class adenine-specific DNA methylase